MIEPSSPHRTEPWRPDREQLDELAGIVGPEHVVTDAERLVGVVQDWTGRFVGSAPALVRPGSAIEVAEVVRWCSRHRVPVVTQGGNTGLVGGSVPLAGELVLSTRRLDRVDDLDPVAGQLTAGAGVTLERVQQVAREMGWAMGVDLAARGSATIGGMVATNAGGVRVVRHGHMRRQVLGLEAVLADGRIVSRLGGLEKDNTGYDLSGLMCGSEGTLGVVTRVRLRLVPPPREPVTALCGLESLEAAVALAGELRRQVPGLSAVEAVIGDAIELSAARLGVEVPFPEAAVHLLVEADGPDADEQLAQVISEAAGDPAAIVATGPGGQLRLWAFREQMTEAIAARGVPLKLDVTLPGSAMASFCAEVPLLVSGIAGDARTVLFGHLADGNIHVNVLGAGSAASEVEDGVLRLVARRGGSISAEHGIGTAKAAWLDLARSPDELSVFADLRQALDPAGILNPAVLNLPGR